jgi:endo-1,4-beta-xylanase
MKSIILLTAVAAWSANARGAEPPALKDAFADAFRVGAALGTAQVLGEEPAALELVAAQYNTVTPENLLKWQQVHPQPGAYNFDPADRFVAWAEEHGMFIVGHTLIWHSQTPRWVFRDSEGQPLSRDALLERMRDHIHSVVGRYKGRIHGWDVVNEAINDDGTMRDTPWLRIIGPDYVQKAFEFAREADPDAELYYNDYNEWHEAKRRGISKLVRDLQAAGVKIDGLGLQGHWGLDYPAIDEIEAMLADYGQLGVKLLVTELDMDVLPTRRPDQGAEVTRRERGGADPYPNGLPDEVATAQAERYAAIFAEFLEHQDKIDRVTFWGVHDGHSWRNYWPVAGRTAYPLLFDRQYQPKPAFEAVIQTTAHD